MKITPKKRIAPTFLSYVGAVLYVVIFISIVVALVTMNWMVFVIPLICLCVLLVMNFTFSWYRSANLAEAHGSLVYEVIELVAVMGKNKTVYTIGCIDSVRKKNKGNTVILYGDIKVKEPMQKEKAAKKCVIRDCDEDVYNIIKGYKNVDL